MKKLSILLCCALIIQMFCSCTANKEEFKEVKVKKLLPYAFKGDVLGE